MNGVELLTRDTLLGGMAGRRATSVLFAVESRTAYLAHESHAAAAYYRPPQTIAAQEQNFLSALAQGRLAVEPTVQELERYAPRWADLVPDNPGIKAAVAQLLSQKYRIAYKSTPRLRAALGLDDAAVAAAFQNQTGQSIDTIYAPSLSLRERWRWDWSSFSTRLEELPPVWTAFALTLTETIGAGILALPIALAGVGPLPGVLLLLVMALVNILTVAAIVEAITRNGHMRYGASFFGRLVSDYLGGFGSLVFVVSLFALNVLTLIAYYLGLASTMTEATGIPAMAWVGVCFLVTLLMLRGKGLNATIASALLVGVINISLIMIMSLMALPYLRLENLLYANLPFVSDHGLEPTLLGLVFGTLLMAYFGHTSAANAAKVVLQREPSGRALLRGNVLALVAAGLLYCLWVIAVNGAIAPPVLAQTTGTALTPLAAVVGPSITLFGSIFVLLGMGMGAIHMSLGLFNQTREWLPRSTRSRAGRLQLGEDGRFLLSNIPGLLVALLVLWLLWSGQQSFTAMINYAGVLTIPILGGVFPVLMLAASRRRGEIVPGEYWRGLGRPIVLVTLWLIFVVSILLHGLMIWQEPLAQGAALALALLLAGSTIYFARRGAFLARVTVELRHDLGSFTRTVLAITARGEPLTVPVVVEDRFGRSTQQAGAAPGVLADAHLVRFDLPGGLAHDLKLWVHQVTEEGISQAQAAQVTLTSAAGTEVIPITEGAGEIERPYPAGPLSLALRVESDRKR